LGIFFFLCDVLLVSLLYFSSSPFADGMDRDEQQIGKDEPEKEGRTQEKRKKPFFFQDSVDNIAIVGVQRAQGQSAHFPRRPPHLFQSPHAPPAGTAGSTMSSGTWSCNLQIIVNAIKVIDFRRKATKCEERGESCAKE
jgi:hypothetical protein